MNIKCWGLLVIKILKNVAKYETGTILLYYKFHVSTLIYVLKSNWMICLPLHTKTIVIEAGLLDHDKIINYISHYICLEYSRFN